MLKGAFSKSKRLNQMAIKISDREKTQMMLEQVAAAYPRLATIFRFRLDKTNQDEKDAVVSPRWANRVRQEIMMELQEMQSEA